MEIVKLKNIKEEGRNFRMQKHIKSLNDLEKEEISGSDENWSVAYSDTDEDENEGLGDGKIGRDTPDLFDK